MNDMKVGAYSAEVKGLTEGGSRRIVVRNVRAAELPAVIEAAKALPGYKSHRTIRRPNGNYDVFVYLSR